MTSFFLSMDRALGKNHIHYMTPQSKSPKLNFLPLWAFAGLLEIWKKIKRSMETLFMLMLLSDDIMESCRNDLLNCFPATEN